MKFINYLETITGVSIYPLSSFMIFFLFFVAVLFYVIKADKKMINEMEKLPLE